MGYAVESMPRGGSVLVWCKQTCTICKRGCVCLGGGGALGNRLNRGRPRGGKRE